MIKVNCILIVVFVLTATLIKENLGRRHGGDIIILGGHGKHGHHKSMI